MGCVDLDLGKEGLLLLGEQLLLFLLLCSWFLPHSLEGSSLLKAVPKSLGPPAIHLFTHNCCVPDLGLVLGYRGSQDRPYPHLTSYRPAKVQSASEQIGVGWVWGPSHLLVHG